MKRTLNVRLAIDPQVAAEELRAYLNGAVFKIRCGSFNFESPIYHLPLDGLFGRGGSLIVSIPDNGHLVSFGLAPPPSFVYVLSVEETLKGESLPIEKVELKG
jgi:hypothetical protein